jgi:hypothetical protein
MLEHLLCPHCWSEALNFILMLRYSRATLWLSMTIARFF